MEDYYKLHLDVVNNRANGKILFQPRIACWYDDKQFAGEELPEGYKGMTLPEIYRKLECSSRIYQYNACFVPVEDSSISHFEERISDSEVREWITTPIGTIDCVIVSNTSNPGVYPKKWWLETEEDFAVICYILEHQTWKWDGQAYKEVYKQWGRLGAPTMFMPRAGIQNLYIDMMGIENTVFALADFPETVEHYFKVLEKNQDQLIDVINESPIQIINFGDNIHCNTLPDCYFEKYVLPVYQRRCEKLHRAGKFVHAHWDGDTKSLLKYAKETGLDGIEAITPLPQGDVTLKEIKEALGDEVWLIDGIAAILFNQEYSEEELVSQVHECIELFAPKLILGISDELSSTGDINRLKLVKQIVDEYNKKAERL